ncbi:B-cell receptor CD22-like [Rhinoraja longicauda]
MYGRLSLTCASRVSDPPVSGYSWYRNGRGYRWAQSLVFDRITPEQAGLYRCTAENEIGSVSSETITVNVLDKPQGVHIVSRVNGVQVWGAVNNVNKYDRLTLTCASRVSYPPVSGYSWYRNGRVYRWAQSLVFDRITPEQEGLYRCTAENKIGSVSSETITVNVLFQPRDVTASLWVNGMRGRTLREGDRVRLSCSYVTADPPVHEYTWYRNGTEIKRGTSPDLEYPSISYSDFGKYVCQATNTVGSTRSAELTLRGKHKPQGVHIESRVNDVQVGSAVHNVNMYDRLILTCASRVSDPPVSRYFWYHNGRVNGWRAQSLVFDGITPEQAGPYRCTAGNEIGNMSSETITVNVLWSTQRKIIASVTPTLNFLILSIPVVFYIRHVHSRRKQVDSHSNVNIDATNVVCSVVKKTRKIRCPEPLANTPKCGLTRHFRPHHCTPCLCLPVLCADVRSRSTSVQFAHSILSFNKPAADFQMELGRERERG